MIGRLVHFFVPAGTFFVPGRVRLAIGWVPASSGSEVNSSLPQVKKNLPQTYLRKASKRDRKNVPQMRNRENLPHAGIWAFGYLRARLLVSI